VLLYPLSVSGNTAFYLLFEALKTVSDTVFDAELGIKC
jgi:hypothetical protein